MFLFSFISIKIKIKTKTGFIFALRAFVDLKQMIKGNV